MPLKYFFVSLFFLSFILPNAQKIQLKSAGKTVADWEEVAKQQINLDSDSTLFIPFLKPLKDRNLDTDKILYDAILANYYGRAFDRVNEKSNRHYLRAIFSARKLNNKELDIWATLNYAEYYYNFRQMHKALPLYISAIEKIEQIGAQHILFPGESFTKIAFYMGTIGDKSEAIKYLIKAKQFTQPNSANYAMILDNLGMYYLKVGDVKNAQENIQQASTLSKSVGDDLRYAKTLGNLAQIYERSGDYARAIELISEDVSISERYKSDQNTMYAYTMLARLFIGNKQISEAKEALEKATAIARTKPYFKINELDILKLKLDIIYKEHRDDAELGIRRRIEVLEDSLNKTDGVLPLNQANWMMQKRKYVQNVASTNQKLSRELFWKNLIFTISGVLIVIVIVMFIFTKNRARKKQIQNEKKIADYEDAKLQIEQKLLAANRTLDSQIDFLKEKNIQIQQLYQEIENGKEAKSSYLEEDRGKLDDLLQSHLMTEENWLNFRREFQKEYPDFYQFLKLDYPEVTDSNLRIILLQKLGFTNAEIAGLLGITIDAVKKSKQRLKHKLGEKYNVLVSRIFSTN